MIESPVRTYLLLGFCCWPNRCAGVEAFAMKGFVDAFVDLNASPWADGPLYLGVMVYGAVIAGAGVSARSASWRT